jgi:small-conductance mechanosensitive channel
LFLIKCTVFLILLSLFSRLFRRFLVKRVLSHTSMDRGQQYALVRAARVNDFETLRHGV